MRRAGQVIGGVAAVLALGCGSSEPDHSPDEAPIAAEPDFFELLHTGYHVSYTLTETAGELAGYSDLVVVGEVLSLEEGGIVGGAHSSIASVRVSEVVRGEPEGPVLYVELLHAPIISTAELGAALPIPNGVWFLQDATDVLGPHELDEDRGRGVPAGERLLGPASPQGLVTDAGGHLAQPLEPEPDGWFANLAEYSSLEQLIDELRVTAN